MKNEIQDIKKEIKPLLQTQDGIYSLNVRDYFRYYGLDFGDGKIQHLFGSFQSGKFTLAAHLFVPKEYKATVVILHGYLGHCGLLSKLIKSLTDANFAVAVFDLPGHGLSSGEPTAIDDFSQYGQALDDFMKVIKSRLNSPYHIIGYSTGATVVMDYFSSGRGDCFDKVILAAPLIRCASWRQANSAFKIFHQFVKYVPRYFRKVSSDKDFLEFIKHKDPLQSKKVSLKWVDAMFKWEKKIADADVINRSIFVIQGTKDNIVAWKDNLKLIESKFSRAEIGFIENGRHELFNESEKTREEVFSLIRIYLEK